MKKVLINVFVSGLVGALFWVAYGPLSDVRVKEESVALASQDASSLPASTEREFMTDSSAFSEVLTTSEEGSKRVDGDAQTGRSRFVKAREPQVDAIDPLDVLPIVESIMFDDAADIREAMIAEPIAVPPAIVSLDRQYFSEEHDPHWAGAKEARLSQLFVESRVLGSQLNSAGCRTTLCRIEISHIDPRAERRFIAEFVRLGEFANDEQTGFYYRAVDSNGAVSSIYYLAREGSTFN